MRRDGIWHPRLAAVLNAAGHGDLIIIADAGLPVAADVESIDLLWRRGEPGLLPIVAAVLAEYVIEEATIAHELADQRIRTGLTHALGTIRTSFTTHADLKEQARNATAVVRTGEATPYANVILRCGVAF